MSFKSAVGIPIQSVRAGEVIGELGYIRGWSNFADGIEAGLFCKYDSATDSIIKVDGTASPVIAGVVRRMVTNALEDGSVFTSDVTNVVNVVENGVVTVNVVAGVVPNKFDPVYVYINTDVATNEWGKATSHSEDLASDGSTKVPNAPVDGYFFEEIETGVWSVRIR